jgi:hypothetical protein
MSYRGIYKPENPKKYLGDPNNIVWRSTWERKMFRYCDTNVKVLKWASEEIVIPYYNPAKRRAARYYPDVYMEYIDSGDTRKKCLIEIKPFKQTQPPKYKRRTKFTLLAEAIYSENTAKWAAAREFCLDQGWEFKVFTEHDLGV